MANANNVIAGVGLLYAAPVGTTAITTATGALPAAYRAIGYTDAGSTVTSSVSSENLEVAEELSPIGVTTTSRTGSVNFAMAEAVAANLALALNLGADWDNTSGDAIEPPDPSDEIYISLVLQTSQGARWWFPKTKNTAEFSLPRAKTGKTLISVEMGIFQETGAPFFKVWPEEDHGYI